MITQVKAYSSWPVAPTMLLDPNGKAETDLIQIRNIVGLDPVTASVGTAPYGGADGEAFVGTSIKSRNIVLTLHPSPDWLGGWSMEALRRLLYSYFMPKSPSRLVFYSNDLNPVDIEGIVEAAEFNSFHPDPDFMVSIVCPDPYFKAINPVVQTGPDNTEVDIENWGNVDIGLELKVEYDAGATCTNVKVRIGDSIFEVATSVDAENTFRMSSVPKNKYVVNDDTNPVGTTSILNKVTKESKWPVIRPGTYPFEVITDAGDQNWVATYSPRFGGL